MVYSIPLKHDYQTEGSIEQVQAMMGSNFFSFTHWEEMIGVQIRQKGIVKIDVDFPWSVETLSTPCPFVKGQRVCDTHFAFQGVQEWDGSLATVNRWCHLYPELFDVGRNMYTIPALKWQPCAWRWYLLPIPSITQYEAKCAIGKGNRSWQMFGAYQETSLVVEVTKMLFYHLLHGEFHPIKGWKWCRASECDLYGEIAVTVQNNKICIRITKSLPPETIRDRMVPLERSQ